MDTDHEERDVLKSLLDYFPGQQVEIMSRTDDGRKWIVATHSDRDAGTFYLFDRDRNSMARLFTMHSDIPAEALSPVQPISYTSVDNLTIHGYLTPGIGTDTNERPMVVMVHGGTTGSTTRKSRPLRPGVSRFSRSTTVGRPATAKPSWMPATESGATRCSRTSSTA